MSNKKAPNDSYSEDIFNLYYNEINKYPILSAEKQKDLARRYIDNGDLKAKELLINSNLRLVVKSAERFSKNLNHLKLLDIVQEGNLGLIRAVETYDPDQGAFTTYAIPWINQRIYRAISEKEHERRKPVWFLDAQTRYLKLTQNSRARGLKLPSDEEVCDILNISIETLDNIRTSLSEATVSLNQTIDDDEKSELGDFIAAKNQDYDDLLNDIVDNELHLVIKEVLRPVYYFIIYNRVLSNEQKTLEQIASLLGITRERVRQIEEASLKKLKPYMVKDSKAFKQTLEKIKTREGKNFKLLKTEPVEPKNIIKYVYLENDLTSLERSLYELILLGKYNYTKKDYALVLGITLYELNEVYVSLRQKIKIKFSDINKFKSFKDEMVKTHGTRIFNLCASIQNNMENKIDYKAISETYSSLSLDTILDYFNSVNYNLKPDEKSLLERYFGTDNEKNYANSSEIEKEINILKYGFKRKEKNVPLKKLYNKYLDVKDKFTLEQQMYLESYIFNVKNKALFKETYPNSNLLQQHNYLVNKLEKYYYNIYGYFENNFTKEDWIEIKERYASFFTEERIQILDLFYGVGGKAYSITELANMFDVEYTKMHRFCREARELAINLYSGIKDRLDIDKRLYAPYIMDLCYSYTDETRLILKYFIIENKDYDEISKITGLSNYRISNIITEGIRKIDNYRFNIIEPFVITEEELNDVFKYYNYLITDEDKEIIKLKYLKYLENKDIVFKTSKTKLEVNKIIARFNGFYKDYKIKDVVLTDDDIIEEIKRHKSESVLTEEQKRFASFYYGFKNKYNPLGEKYNKEKIMEKFGYNKNTYYNTCTGIISALKARKIGYIKPDANYIPRDELDKLLDDKHLPISDKEREIICHMFELKGYSYMTINELSKMYSEKTSSIRRRYQRAIVSIYKYLNNEIEGIIDYDKDIVPILKYFSNSDCKLIEDYYKNGLTFEQISKKHNITFYVAVNLINKIKYNVTDLIKNPNAKKFDFDYYLEVVNNPDLPFFGNLELAKQIFEMVFGMTGKKESYPSINEKLNLNMDGQHISKILYSLMLSTCKYKDGITKDKEFSYEEIYSYYLKHCNSMTNYYRNIYLKYFEKIKEKNLTSIKEVKVPYDIILDLIKDKYPDAFTLNNATKKEVLEVLKKYDKKLNVRVKKSLMRRYDIPERIFMNGKDINHVFKMLNTLDVMRKEQKASILTLKK